MYPFRAAGLCKDGLCCRSVLLSPFVTQKEWEEQKREKGGSFSAKCYEAPNPLNSTLTRVTRHRLMAHCMSQTQPGLGLISSLSPILQALEMPFLCGTRSRQRQLFLAFTYQSCLDSMRVRTKHFLLVMAFIKTLAYFN